MYDIEIYLAKFYKDKPLKNAVQPLPWMIPIQAGAALTQERVEKLTDYDGENISTKNANYCELTVLYWIWRNRVMPELCRRHGDGSDNVACQTGKCADKNSGGNRDRSSTYYGLYHYRRWLDVHDVDWQRIYDRDVDVVLPYPTVHEPDIREHHARYMKESDWEAVLQALQELAPEYYDAYDAVFSQEYLYNYNILIAKAEVLDRYCSWLFPILERIEELSNPKGCERADRYIGYIGENLLTLYFMFHKEKLRIACTGRMMFT